ncbi:MAG: AMP-binding protein, partial [Pseudomonadota bacterium]
MNAPASYPPSEEYQSRSLVSNTDYEAMYARSIQDPEGFWRDQARRLSWIKPFSKVSDVSFDASDLHIRWFEDGTLNACYNCVDRHLDQHGDETAIIWEGDEPDRDEKISYRELHERACRFANVLKGMGVEKGDRVTLYLPMIPETAVAMLACARIGAVHSVVFGGFSPDALADRIVDCRSKVVVTADLGRRGGKTVPLKANVDEACTRAGVMDTLEGVLVVRNVGDEVSTMDHDVWLHEAAAGVSNECAIEEMNAEEPLFILYTSGSTGKPKGVLHTTGGYLLYASLTHELVFDYRPGDIYWCTADVGWVTGHSYIVYGPLANR